MGVRVRIGIEYRDKYIEATALVNTGYEGDVPEVLIPIQFAERLGVWPSLPGETIVETYRSASGLMRSIELEALKYI